ncbi:GatB YqeY domain-containing protein [Pluteus cervinus]|uniref:GatB YqeY domain-containing protein n=1 Tax=Pluteus cervinus TaxID=181527 RepID=A0ACD3BAY8_9AGAR|nr:GatB YqeY domain-containing protein [Pluteus cervinus]
MSTNTPLKPGSTELRARLMENVKSAMKARDTFTSILLRSVLAEIYAADKNSRGQVSHSTEINIVRKAISRRQDCAAQFAKAGREDLASKEEAEAKQLSEFVPPLMSEDQVTEHLLAAFQSLAPKDITEPRKATGMLLKLFYGQVDKSSVDADVVTRLARDTLKSIKTETQN